MYFSTLRTRKNEALELIKPTSREEIARSLIGRKTCLWAGNEAFAHVDARSLSDIMHPKCDKSLFDKCGGSVEAIAATLKVDLQRGISGNKTDIEERIRQ